MKNEATASRSYVVSDGTTVVAYYSLAAGAITHAVSSGRVRRTRPDPIPPLVLGRLAVDRHDQGRGLGKGLLHDAILRALQAAEAVGVRAILVHGLSDDARRFYQAVGFLDSPKEPLTLCLPLETARAALAPPRPP